MKHKTDRYTLYSPKPPPEYATINQYIGYKRGQRWGLLVVWLMILSAIVLFIVTRADAAADWLCDYVQALTVYDNVQVAEWVGYPEGWADMPIDLDNQQLLLPISEDGQQAYLIKTSTLQREQWIWTYKSMRTWTDQNGEHDGHHDFCSAVLRIKLDG